MSIHCPPFTPMVEVLPEHKGQRYAIEHFTLDAATVERIQLSKSGFSLEWSTVEEMEPGKYVSLVEPGRLQNDGKRTVWMSDTPHERKTCLPVIDNAFGDVLIAGLGLGMILVPLVEELMLDQGIVETITVIERDPWIIEAVGPPLYDRLGPNFRIEEANAWVWRPKPKHLRYDTIWLDIWPDIADTNLPAMRQLKNRYSGWLKPGGWLGVWSEDQATLMDRALKGNKEAVMEFLSPRDKAFLETGVDPLTGMTREDYQRHQALLEQAEKELERRGFKKLPNGFWQDTTGKDERE